MPFVGAVLLKLCGGWQSISLLDPHHNMLQMPTSTLSMFSSSSKSLDGFFGLICVGIQMVLTVVLSDSFKTEFTTTARATATVKVVLQPTKCVLFNGTDSLPYVAAMGYATIVFLSLVYILRAKGFGTGDQPPSPPSDADTESNAKKRPNRWLWLLLILLVSMVLLSLGAGIFVAYLVPSLRVLHPLQAFGVETVRIVERKFLEEWTWAASNLSAFATHIFLHGRQHTKIVFLALASHFASIIPGSHVLRRIYRRVSFLGLKLRETVILVVIVPWSIIAAIPQLRWIFWMMWDTSVPPMNDINQEILRIPRHFSLLATKQPVHTVIILGPATVHVAIMCLISLLLGVYRIPGATIRFLSRRLEQDYCLVFAAVYIVGFPLVFIADWNQILPVFWLWLQRHQAWKSVQKHDFAMLAPKFPHAFMQELHPALELWGSLPWPKKLLIIAPALLFYIYFDVIPNVRSLRRIYVKWRNMLIAAPAAIFYVYRDSIYIHLIYSDAMEVPTVKADKIPLHLDRQVIPQLLRHIPPSAPSLHTIPLLVLLKSSNGIYPQQSYHRATYYTPSILYPFERIVKFYTLLVFSKSSNRHIPPAEQQPASRLVGVWVHSTHIHLKIPCIKVTCVST
ncbi:hypothetical protein B0H16DRAFT_1757844 [Mycena metata]|uniref:Uncharacterized protein n=1 Tax=Mycena metata TaxID=1033252 RepID=A0AAD7IFG5_9AGAR|nr:hypothetical protein B0H16DRAFT_1757844 [Mycena metata]